MWRRPAVTILMLIIAVILTLPLRAQQKPFTQEQVSNMVRDGFGDESGAKVSRALGRSQPKKVCQPPSAGVLCEAVGSQDRNS